MKLARLLSTSALSFSVLLGATSLIYGQEQKEDAKPPQEESRPEAAKPRQDEAKPQKQDQDRDKPARNEEKPVKQDDARNAKQAQQAADNHGGRIPDDKFRAHFGRQHTFVVNRPTVVGGQPRFQYGGYSFVIVDAWPADWAYTDQCYIDYIDGQYFLFDVLHPGVQIALSVVF